jgi:hypothetical protein
VFKGISGKEGVILFIMWLTLVTMILLSAYVTP